MKLKLNYTPKKDANGYFLLLPNRNEKRFKTIKAFDRWFLGATNELNGTFKNLLLLYPCFAELYCEIYIRSNVQNANRLGFIQKTHNETFLLSRIIGIVPTRGFYECFSDLYKLISYYKSLLNTYYQEYSIFSDRYVLAQIKMYLEILETQKQKLDSL